MNVTPTVFLIIAVAGLAIAVMGFIVKIASWLWPNPLERYKAWRERPRAIYIITGDPPTKADRDRDWDEGR